ncbi:hypothetical protein AOLI_G00222820 [Acnodon oligacanthus]
MKTSPPLTADFIHLLAVETCPCVCQQRDIILLSSIRLMHITDTGRRARDTPHLHVLMKARGVGEAAEAAISPNYPGSPFVPVWSSSTQTKGREVAGGRGHWLNLVLGVLGSGGA